MNTRGPATDHRHRCHLALTCQEDSHLVQSRHEAHEALQYRRHACRVTSQPPSAEFVLICPSRVWLRAGAQPAGGPDHPLQALQLRCWPAAGRATLPPSRIPMHPRYPTIAAATHPSAVHCNRSPAPAHAPPAAWSRPVAGPAGAAPRLPARCRCRSSCRRWRRLAAPDPASRRRLQGATE
jgi:hypothetical protein